MLMPFSSLKIFSWDDRSLKMAFKAFLFLGIVFGFVLYHVDYSFHMLKDALYYVVKAYQIVWYKFEGSYLGELLTSKCLPPNGYQPFFTYTSISFAEILLPCFLKSCYVNKRLRVLLGPKIRVMFSIYFALLALYASNARKRQSIEFLDLILVLMNSVLLFRTLDIRREKPVETVITVALTCAHIVPMHMALDMATVMCLSQEVVKAYREDTARLKVFASCVALHCLIVQVSKLLDLSNDQLTNEMIQMMLSFTVSVILINVAMVSGRPTDMSGSFPAFVTLLYIYSRNCKT